MRTGWFLPDDGVLADLAQESIVQERAVMRGATIISIIATACLSIAGSLVAAALFLQPAPSAESSASTTTDIVAAFYDAANEAIATGNTRPLAAILSPGFVDREPALGETPDRDGLLSYLLALHAANPAVQLQADPILGAGNRAMARVTVTNGGDLQGLSDTIGGIDPPWAPVELFRVENGVIAERWSSNDGLTLLRPLASGITDLPTPSPRQLALQRVTLPPGATFDRRADGPSFVLLEKGSLQLQLTSHASRAEEYAKVETIPLIQGQSFAVPPFSQLHAMNVGGSEAQMLMVRFDLPRLSTADAVTAHVATPIPNGAASQTLAGDLAVEVAAGPWRLGLAVITLGSQAEVAVSAAAGPVLVAVDAGELVVTPWGQAWRRNQDDGMHLQTSAKRTTLPYGDGLTLLTRSQTTMENATSAPATAIVLTLHPIQGAPGAQE